MHIMHKGSCHCGAVRFEADMDATKGSRCNCSICTKLNPTGAITKPSAFRLVRGEEVLSAYEWGHHVSKRFFCSKCGVYCFAKGHLVELGGDYVSINLQALDDIDPGLLEIGHWDGRHDNWQGGMRAKPWPIHDAKSV